MTRGGTLGWVRVAVLAATTGWGCQPTIGDKCVLSTDCSTRGDRQCDTSQPGGYCTIPNCRANTCPDKASCVLFRGTVPGCVYDDRSLARTGRSFCSAACASDGDCRAGYVCRDPRSEPWKGVILDDGQAVRTCLASPTASSGPEGAGEPPVCRSASPDVAPIEAGAGSIEPREAGTDSADTGIGGGDDGGDASLDGARVDGGGPSDAGLDAPADG